MNIIVVGGAGYIGSHVVKEILENTDYNVSIIDNHNFYAKIFRRYVYVR